MTGPGVSLEILNVAIASGKAKVTFKLTDGAGLPLDRTGLYTVGAVTTRFVLSWLDDDGAGNPLQYTSYTTRTQTSPITSKSSVQATTDEGGAYAEVDWEKGIYSYELAAPVNPSDPDKTHTLGAWATREFEGVHHVANAVYDFLPAGGTVVTRREVVIDSACNACHGSLRAHDGDVRDARLCTLCHSPQSADPDTGNTLDLGVMLHKVHRGEALPGVVAGVPYQLIGDQQVHDYSGVAYPQEVQRCESCHQGANASYWKDRPTRATCGSCHDRTAFANPVPAGFTLHTGDEQLTDANCKVCHLPQGGLHGVVDKHLTLLTDPATPKLELSIISVQNTGPGQIPTLQFQVTLDGVPRDIVTSPLTRLAVTVAGPTTDYAHYWQTTIQGAGATGTLMPVGAGIYQYTLPMTAQIPSVATGTYAFALEGYLATSAAGPRNAARNPIFFAAVTDATPVPRRPVALDAKCNQCHFKLSAHGGARLNVDYCAFCHNPNNPADDRISRFESATVTAETVGLGPMVHLIHMGDALTQQPSYLYGNPTPTKANPGGTPIDFGKLRYPRDRRECEACHVAGTQELPLGPGLLPYKELVLACSEDPLADGDSYCDLRAVQSERFMAPATAVCSGCHDSSSSMAHAQTNTTAAGVEACATCHGPGSTWDVKTVHAPQP